jgi:glyoxylase-like metal-dependent hydrolase (beta-lactamase superfamily II)
MEVAPGIHRIESDLGTRLMCQFLLVGDERTVLLDTGLSVTPSAVIVPYLASMECRPDGLDVILISHADVDHCGGNKALREMAPRAVFVCHELDRRWIESNRLMLSENYSWQEKYGFGPSDEAKEWILTELGGDAPIEIGLLDGATIRLGPTWSVEVMHFPGHTLGHIGVWDPRSRTALVVDAVLERGAYDRAGELLVPPRYYDVNGYRETIKRVRDLRPDLLLTAHNPPFDAEGARGFLDRSMKFVETLDQIVVEGLSSGISGLKDMTDFADMRLGHYPEFATELAASVRAHLALHTPGQ